MSEIRETAPRKDVSLSLPDGRIFSAPLGTDLEQVLRAAYPGEPFRYLAALCDNELHTLRYAPERDCVLAPLDRKDGLGRVVYNRSLVLLMVAALREVLPGVRVFTEYRMPMGGLYCSPSRHLEREELEAVERRMQEIVAEDRPVTFCRMPAAEAEGILKAQGEEAKIYLMKRAADREGMVWMVRSGELTDYFHNVLVSSMGYLTCFALRPCHNGFMLVSSRQDIRRAEALGACHSLVDDSFRAAVRLAHKIGVTTIPKLNSIVASSAVREAVLICEASQSGRIDDIARSIVTRPEARVVFIAGPSSSGKTTFSKRLAIALQTYGVKPVTLEMDRYFVERSKTPRDAKGEYDFESIHAMDLELLDHDLNALIAGEEVTLPEYDFVTGTRKAGPKLRLSEGQVLVAEGIHGLNPLMAQGLERSRIFRIYISPLTPLNIDCHNHISTRTTRLLRRIVRDARTRGHSAEATILRWPSIQDGEYRNIFPYQNQADAIFNSILLYEDNVLRPFAEPLLLQIPRESPAYPKARDLLQFLGRFESMDPGLVPENSLLREFVGGSVLEQYLPGQLNSFWSVEER